MVTAAVLERNIRDEIYLNPMPVQVFADDIVLAANNLSVIKSMIAAAESKMVCRLSMRSVLYSMAVAQETIGTKAKKMLPLQ